MASSKPTNLYFVFIHVTLSLFLCMHGVHCDLTSILNSFLSSKNQEGITCEFLDIFECAFAVSSSGNRCVLEKKLLEYTNIDDKLYCTTSNVKTDKVKDHIETDKCMTACGLDRNTIGISSDSFSELNVIRKLCSVPCYHGCPNIIDLYFNLAIGEGKSWIIEIW